MIDIILVAHNIRSAENVGSLIRTSEGLGVKELYLTGFTPYPRVAKDTRLPHIINKVDGRIKKTSLGSEAIVQITHSDKIEKVIAKLRSLGFKVVALEQTEASIPITKFKPETKVAVLVGNELVGIDNRLLALCDYALQIPMMGAKESFNVAQAAAMALFYLRFMS